MGQNEKENTKYEIPVFEIASMEYKHAKEYNRNQQSNTQPKNKDDKKEWLTIKEIDLIIQNIPVILQYFIPGFLCLIIFKIITGTNTSNKYTAILSCVFSYILLSVSELIFIWIKSLEQFKTNVYVRSVISIIMGLVFYPLSLEYVIILKDWVKSWNLFQVKHNIEEYGVMLLI